MAGLSGFWLPPLPGLTLLPVPGRVPEPGRTLPAPGRDEAPEPGRNPLLPDGRSCCVDDDDGRDPEDPDCPGLTVEPDPRDEPLRDELL